MIADRLMALATCWSALTLVSSAAAAELPARERGEKALLERSFSPPGWSLAAYKNAWRHWGLQEAPTSEKYDELYRQRYGLHPAPYPNNGLPMGLREAPSIIPGRKGLTTDCLLCHGGSIMGQSYIGLGNSTLEIQSFFEEMSSADGLRVKTPFSFGNVRGTSEAGGMAVFLIGYREPDLSMRKTRLEFTLRDDLCEDPPAWWLLKKKKTMYHTGGADARSVRSIMQFMMSPLNTRDVFHREEETFRDIQAYILSLEPPKYPYPVDRSLAQKGEQLFVQNCAKCHGTYGESATYPNRVVPLAEIGTDPNRYQGIPVEVGQYYNTTWFAKEKSGWFLDEYKVRHSPGYQAPPLDGVWATAPYFHNGAVPTVYHVLNSKARPKIYTRSFGTNAEDYDAAKLGWKVTILDAPADRSLPPIERRKIYDTTQPGRGNGGHTFGDHLTDKERMAVIEYLKTL
jgi:RoxA-like, cytochrome c-like